MMDRQAVIDLLTESVSVLEARQLILAEMKKAEEERKLKLLREI